MIKLNLSKAMIRLMYKFVDVEFSGNVAIPDDRMIEYSYALSRVIRHSNSNSKVLDVGCVARINVVPQTLCELNYKVTGIDVREFSYKHDNFKFIRDNMKDHDFKNEKFDVVTLVSTLEHIGIKGRYGIDKDDDEADYRTIEKAYEILNSSGVLILTVPYNEKCQRHGIHRVYNKPVIDNLFLGKFKIIDTQYYEQLNGIFEYSIKSKPTSHLICVTAIKF